jgi:hypothetical protein
MFHAGMCQRRNKTDKNSRFNVLVASETGDLNIKVEYNLHISQLPRPLPPGAKPM